jgi:hypothetical protein
MPSRKNDTNGTRTIALAALAIGEILLFQADRADVLAGGQGLKSFIKDFEETGCLELKALNPHPDDVPAATELIVHILRRVIEFTDLVTDSKR